MSGSRLWTERLKFMLMNQRLLSFLIVLLLIGLNIMILGKISFVFHPFKVLLETIFLPLILTGVAFYLLNPIVEALEKYRIKRAYSILILYLLVAGILTLIIITVIPLLKEQIISLIDSFPYFSSEAQLQFEQLIGSKYFNQIQQTLGFDSSSLTSAISDYASGFMNNAWTSIGGLVSKVTETVLTIIVVPLILFYLLKDRRELTPYILSFLPTRLRDRSYAVMLEMNHQISSYIRGQIIDSCCVGLLLYIGYLIIGLDYSLVLAVIASCTSVVPYLGPAIAIFPALIVAMVTSPMMLLKMVIVWTVVQVVEGKVFTPQIMGKTMHIHPITIIFVILTAGKMFGILGIILAVPGYAILKVITTHLFRWFKAKSGLYEETK
ncbi:putative PurR-regulated permease PerM [Paenibacillus taihuensis]|uniref:Putative PurR-regulated permease PerM n=1 Tax=Paenibacillus taihuensis TaxID=1156355 RepID=A0A3D9SH60_9BACL|nr:AI-2E family transporter [Paenibacillus taihuensis]REE91625.1 putative PurR-regulated permease PerM [Paenibacillus taihuensis]